LSVEHQISNQLHGSLSCCLSRQGIRPIRPSWPPAVAKCKQMPGRLPGRTVFSRARRPGPAGLLRGSARIGTRFSARVRLISSDIPTCTALRGGYC
jgi:hypothetical protein